MIFYKHYFFILVQVINLHFIVAAFQLRHPEKRIVGGENSIISREPYQLAMKMSGTLICGAAIINQQWAVTAAHCIDTVEGYQLSDISLYAGSTYYVTNGTNHTPLLTIKHPEYNTSTNDNDIALIKVSPPFYKLPSKNVNKIKLPKPYSEVPAGQMCTVSGWGSEAPTTEAIPIKLRAVEVPIISQKLCQDEYQAMGVIVTDNMICAGYKNGGKDSCEGDSGGPLNCRGALCGIVSWGSNECAAKYKAGVYTRVSNYIFWITKTIYSL